MPAISIQTALGDLRVVDRNLPDGSPATAVIRPEGIRVLRDDRGTARFEDATILHGSITDLTDQGAMTSVRVATGGGQLLVTLSPTAAANLDLHPGKEVRVAIPPERVHLIAGPH